LFQILEFIGSKAGIPLEPFGMITHGLNKDGIESSIIILGWHKKPHAFEVEHVPSLLLGKRKRLEGRRGLQGKRRESKRKKQANSKTFKGL
jgi:hypothetical protein